MSKPGILTTLTFCFLFLSLALKSQAQLLVNPGISEHHYKMPNNAFLAKKPERSQHSSAVMNPVYTADMHQTTKYGVRPATIIFIMHEKSETININPLTSIANYKTQPIPKTQPASDQYSASLN